MNRVSPLVAPVMDEDFDLCISETNLPFPYSDHCSTGPPSLYEFEGDDDDDEDEDDEEHSGDSDEGDADDGDDNNDEGDDNDGDHSEDDVLREEVLEDDDSDEDPTLNVARLNTSRSTDSKTLSDLPRQLQNRLEHVSARSVRHDTSLIPPAPKMRPRSHRMPSS
ncbi:hypothetical protein BGZ99_004686, partial [Dissophora globulifera]